MLVTLTVQLMLNRVLCNGPDAKRRVLGCLHREEVLPSQKLSQNMYVKASRSFHVL